METEEHSAKFVDPMQMVAPANTHHEWRYPDGDVDKSHLFYSIYAFKCPECQYEHRVTFSLGQVSVSLDGAVYVEPEED